jgi:hypothetical protein
MRKAKEGAGQKGLPLTRGESVGPDLAQDVLVTLRASHAIDVTTAFLAVIDHIRRANRQPTAWEAGCLYAALCALAIGRQRNALHRIRLALLPGANQKPPIDIIPLPKAEELLQVLTIISSDRWNRIAKSLPSLDQCATAKAYALHVTPEM